MLANSVVCQKPKSTQISELKQVFPSKLLNFKSTKISIIPAKLSSNTESLSVDNQLPATIRSKSRQKQMSMIEENKSLNKMNSVYLQ